MSNFDLKKYLAEGKLFKENELLKEEESVEVEISVMYAKQALEMFYDTQFSKMGEATSTNTFKFKNPDDAEDFVEHLDQYGDIPADEIDIA